MDPFQERLERLLVIGLLEVQHTPVPMSPVGGFDSYRAIICGRGQDHGPIVSALVIVAGCEHLGGIGLERDGIHGQG